MLAALPPLVQGVIFLEAMMANESKKTEHSGLKKGSGAYWGYKKDAKHESNKKRREDGKTLSKAGRHHP